MQYRCYHPPYGFKFHLLNSEIVSVTLCWQCNNAAVWVSTDLRRSAWFTFDGESPTALALLDICQQHLPLRSP